MRNKVRVTGDMMHVVGIDDPMFYGRTAKKMSSDLLRKHHRGPGDNIESAIYRVEAECGVDANIIKQGWSREPRPMLVHRWLPLFIAWCEAGFAKADAAYEAEKSRHDDNTALVRLADIISGSRRKAGSQESDGEG